MGTHIITDENKGPLLKIFLKEIGNAQFLTKTIRTAIKKSWAIYLPDASDGSLRVLLSTMEKEYYTNGNRWNIEQLTNRITQQLMDLQDELIDAPSRGEVQRAGIILEKITKSNELLARVNHIYDAVPIANITIQTNINEDFLIQKLNKVTTIKEIINEPSALQQTDNIDSTTTNG